MNTRLALLAVTGALGLCACTEESEAPTVAGTSVPSYVQPGISYDASVDAALVATWFVPTGTYKGDTVRLYPDSLIWGNRGKRNMIKTIVSGNKKRFFANHGIMGWLDSSRTKMDSVKFEYLQSGDTLWMEYQTGLNSGGVLNRSDLYYTHALIRVR
ncbi:MAG: hypothetical protein RL318_2996 [Fibrobacterota bacterium]|jgi:hypothetical protein